jgi:hypothetical protein
MWHTMANSLNTLESTSYKRNYLYDCLTATFYLKKALSEIDSYIDNFECPKKSIEYYKNHIFIHSLGYYSQNPNLKKDELKDLENIKNLGFAYSKVDDLLCKKYISPLEAKLKMKNILEFMLKCMDSYLLREIYDYNFLHQLNLVENKRSFLENLLNMRDKTNNSKIDFILEFIRLKIN